MRSFFCASKNKRSATERAKDALHSSESGGGLCGYGWQAVRNAMRSFFAQAKKSGVQRSVRRMSSIAQRATEGFTAKNTVHCLIFASVSLAIRKFFCASKK